ncbi:MAG: hypothetical protein IT384_34005 [Deltaproteobacteria bacterium]|nr:hypothetical protein [Deltaproteobacteria bacterium]
MLELSKYILQALYEANSQAGAPVDVMGTLLGRWPQLPPDDVRAHLGSLAAQGLVAIRGDGTGAITNHGVRILSQLWESGAFGAQQGQAQAQAEAQPQHAQAQGGPAAPTARLRLQRLRGEIDAITAELSSAAGLPMMEWSQALELTTQLEQSAEALDRLLASIGQ